LAERCGLTQSYLSLLERGARSPTLTQLARLAEVLCLPLHWFINGTTQPGHELRDLAVELFNLGVVDLIVPESAVPGAFRPPEQVVALVLSGNAPDPRVVEAIPAVLAWNVWNPWLLEGYGRSFDARALYRLAWLVDILLTINQGRGFPGGCVDPFSLSEFLRRIPSPETEDDLGRPSSDDHLSPVFKRWRVTYAADLDSFRQRAERLLDLRRDVKGGNKRARTNS